MKSKLLSLKMERNLSFDDCVNLAQQASSFEYDPSIKEALTHCPFIQKIDILHTIQSQRGLTSIVDSLPLSHFYNQEELRELSREMASMFDDKEKLEQFAESETTYSTALGAEFSIVPWSVILDTYKRLEGSPAEVEKRITQANEAQVLFARMKSYQPGQYFYTRSLNECTELYTLIFSETAILTGTIDRSEALALLGGKTAPQPAQEQAPPQPAQEPVNITPLVKPSHQREWEEAIQSSKGKEKKILYALLHRALGKTWQEIADYFDVDRRTALRWVENDKGEKMRKKKNLPLL